MSEATGVQLGVDGLSDAVRIGQGSYGVVYRASQPAYGRTVAVKMLTVPLLDDDARRRFERECKALGSLSGHPHIVTLHAAGITDDGHPYMIMDYLSGGSLAGQLAAGPLPWRTVLDIGVKLSGALAAAHEQGILHRDLKPENVLVSAYGEPQLADFGVAKVQGGTATSSATITGSLAHAAPEVISGVPASVASDIWSLASTLATLLSGDPPFHRSGDETLAPLITRILTQPPQDLRPLGVPEALCQLIEHSLAKDSWERPQSAVEFGRALQDIQRGLAIAPTNMAAAASLAGAPAGGPAPAAAPAPAVAPAVSAGPEAGQAAATPPPVRNIEPETATRRRVSADTPDPLVAPVAPQPAGRRLFPRQGRPPVAPPAAVTGQVAAPAASAAPEANKLNPPLVPIPPVVPAGASSANQTLTGAGRARPLTAAPPAAPAGEGPPPPSAGSAPYVRIRSYAAGHPRVYALLLAPAAVIVIVFAFVLFGGSGAKAGPKTLVKSVPSSVTAAPSTVVTTSTTTATATTTATSAPPATATTVTAGGGITTATSISHPRTTVQFRPTTTLRTATTPVTAPPTTPYTAPATTTTRPLPPK